MVAYLVANELVTSDMLVEYSYRGLLESHIYPARGNFIYLHLKSFLLASRIASGALSHSGRHSNHHQLLNSELDCAPHKLPALSDFSFCYLSL
jgi:hypothetical protein